MLGTDNRKLLHTLSLFVAIFYFSYLCLVMSSPQNTELCFKNLSCYSQFQQSLQKLAIFDVLYQNGLLTLL